MQLRDLLTEATEKVKHRKEVVAKEACVPKKVGKMFYLPILGRSKKFKTLQNALMTADGIIAFIEDVTDELGIYYYFDGKKLKTCNFFQEEQCN